MTCWQTNYLTKASLAANWEYRISLLEHDVSVLQGKVPKGKIRRAFWLLFNGFLIATPIVGGYAAIYGRIHGRRRWLSGRLQS